MQQVPSAVFSQAELLLQGERAIPMEAIIIAVVLAIIALLSLLTKELEEFHCKVLNVLGRKVMGGQNSFLPLKVNTAGVMPVIFASAIMFVPVQLVSFFPNLPNGSKHWDMVFTWTLGLFCSFWPPNHIFYLFLHRNSV